MEPAEERAALTLEGLPEWVWNGEQLPVPIEDITESWFNLLIREVEDLSTAPGCPPLADGQALSGLLLPARGEIWVNKAEAQEWPGRRRFTIAHELGHWCMHQTGQQSLFCRKTSVDEEEPRDEKPATTKPPLPPTEAEANAFAAALLMPPDLMRHHYTATEKDFHRMCELFGSSRAAMGKRMHSVI
ncbi:hypothetical protein BH10ACT11_BH10ACT11_15910 [soil metagenome]